jgi:signal peptidase II
MNDAMESQLNKPWTAPQARPVRGGRKWWVLFVVAAIVFAADQATKYLIRSHLQIGEAWPSLSAPIHLEHVTNSGAAFGMLQNQTAFLVITSLIGLGAIVLYFVYPPFHHPLLRVAFGLMLGGAIGNLLDRVRVGNVTDFIKFPHYATFNVADSAICIGVAILAWFLLFREGRQRGEDA